MLSAEDYNGDKCLAWMVEKNQGPFFCPECANELILKKGRVKQHHFAHSPGCDCLCGVGESDLHLRAKKEIYEALIKYTEVFNCEIEKSFGKDLRSDIYFEINNNKVCIEIQRSTINIDDIRRRMVKYNQLGINVIWIIPYKLGEYDNEQYSTKQWQKYLHVMFYGRIYEWYFQEQVRPLHFDNSYTYVEEYYNEYSGDSYGGYHRKHKRYKRLNYCESLVNLVYNFKGCIRESFNTKHFYIPECRIWMDNEEKWW
jgi:competence protein CoiA